MPHLTRLEKDSTNRYNAMVLFMAKYCKMNAHWCDGTPIPKDAREYETDISINKRSPCMYHDIERGCLHPKRPRRSNGPAEKDSPI